MALSFGDDYHHMDKPPPNVNLKDFVKTQRCAMAFLRIIELLQSELTWVNENQQDNDIKSKQASDDTSIFWPLGSLDSFKKWLVDANIGMKEVAGGKGSFHLSLSASTEHILAPTFRKNPGQFPFSLVLSLLALSCL